MKKRIKYELEAMERVDLFGKRTDVTFTPWQLGLFATVSAGLTTLRGWGEGQIAGLQTQCAGTARRHGMARDIFSRLRDIADVAKCMEEEGRAGMSELFRYPRKPTSEGLMLTAESFAERAQGFVAEFVTRGMPPEFISELQASIATFRAATAMKHTGKANRTAGTAGLADSAAAGMKAVRMLRSVMRIHLKSDPALLGTWVLAARVERGPAKAKVATAECTERTSEPIEDTNPLPNHNPSHTVPKDRAALLRSDEPSQRGLEARPAMLINPRSGCGSEPDSEFRTRVLRSKQTSSPEPRKFASRLE